MFCGLCRDSESQSPSSEGQEITNLLILNDLRPGLVLRCSGEVQKVTAALVARWPLGYLPCPCRSGGSEASRPERGPGNLWQGWLPVPGSCFPRCPGNHPLWFWPCRELCHLVSRTPSGTHLHLSSTHFLTDPLCPQGTNIISLKFLGDCLR